MPTFIKTGFWDKMISNNPAKAKAPIGWLNLDRFVQSIIPPSLGVTVNGVSTQTIQIGPSSLVDVTNPSTGTSVITLKPEIPYKAYRAKIATQTIDWPGYGYLYNWYAVDDARGLANPDGGTGLTAPNEWRVPSDIDWNTLETFAGGSSVAGGKLKSTLTSTAYPFYGWLSNGGGTDNYNFSALPGGNRNNNGTFFNIGYDGFWWSSTQSSTNDAWYRYLFSNNGIVSRSNFNKTYGFSVRCLRD